MQVSDSPSDAVPLIVKVCVEAVERRGLFLHLLLTNRHQGLDSVGIYRLSGNAATVQKLKQRFCQCLYYRLPLFFVAEPVNLDDEEWADINAITGVLKLYLRELKNPIMTFERYDSFIECSSLLINLYGTFTLLRNDGLQYPSDFDKKASGKSTTGPLRYLVVFDDSFEKVIHATEISSLGSSLIFNNIRVSTFASENKMETSNLAIIFGPTLLRSQEESFNSVMNMGFQNSLIESILIQSEWIFDRKQ